MSIKHVVVVLFENRSYDNVLGWLFNASNQPPYQTPPTGQVGLNGLTGGESNPDPHHPGKTIPVANQNTPTQINQTGPAYAPTAIPLIDPGEFFCDMAQQITGSKEIPKTNPYTHYPPADISGLTQGYTLNYATLCGLGHPGSPVPAANIPDIMNYLTPAQMPVSAFLARNYAVCDQWYASAPTQTYANRAFALCAAPGVAHSGKYSLIEDMQYLNPFEPVYNIPSVLSQLDVVMGARGEPGPYWKVYFQDYSIAVQTVPQVRGAAKSEDNMNLAVFDDSDWGDETPAQLTSTTTSFVADLAAGKLPPFSFIEPRYFDNFAPSKLPSACNHPGRGNYPPDFMAGKVAAMPIDAATGEVFLMQLYNLLRASPSWNETLLIVTYDEHGGLYDHCAPPVATPPGGAIPPASDTLGDSTADGFNYNLLGGRVPAIIISPLIAAGGTIRAKTAFDHSSIVRTVFDIFNLSTKEMPSLTARDAAAPSVNDYLAQSTVNATDAFSGLIVAGPGSLVFLHDFLLPINPDAQSILASAGPGIDLDVTVSQPLDCHWLRASSSASTSPQINVITVSADVSGLGEGTYTGSVVISGDAANSPLTIPVTLVIQSIFS